MIQLHRKELGTKALCEALELPRTTFYRSSKPKTSIPSPIRSPRRLSDDEERCVLDILHSERFRDLAPAEISAMLLDGGAYHCSERTMYRILARHGESVQRRQSMPRHYARPELLATRPDELWSWDITKLKGPEKWTYFYLYKILDVFSRYIVGWMVAPRESAALAEGLIADTCLKQNIVPGQLTIHADRGSSMTSATVGQLLADLGVTKTHSRPHVSNDNPYSESEFKTLKYRPDFPECFGSLAHSRLFIKAFVTWYNTEHRHSGIAMVTPEQVHYGYHQKILDDRTRILTQAYHAHPERFVSGLPKVRQVPEQVWINKPNFKEQEKPLVVNLN